MEVRTVRDPKSRLGKAFGLFPFGLYKHTPQWVPPFLPAIQRILSGRHPFFDHSHGEACIVLEGSTVLGRFVLLEPRRFNEYTGNRHVRIAIPEAVDRTDVWDLMFDHARNWAAQRDAAKVLGPQGFDPIDGSGALVEGFEHRASMTMMPYHHPFVSAHFERAGFAAHTDFVSARVMAEGFAMPEKVRRVADRAAAQGVFSVEHPRGYRDLQKLGREIGDIYNRAWGEHAGFRPLTTRELDSLIADLGRLSVPNAVTAVRARATGDLAGFLLPFPDLSLSLQRSGGYRGVRTSIDISRSRRRSKHWIINGVGVLPEYRNQGATALMYTALADRLHALGAEQVEMTQIAETTDLVLSDIQTLGGTVYKRHRVYQTDL